MPLPQLRAAAEEAARHRRPQRARRPAGLMLAAENLVVHLRLLLRWPGRGPPTCGTLPLRLVEGAFPGRQRFRFAQHLEAHVAGQRRHFQQPDLDAVRELVAFARALPEQGARGLVVDIVIAVER